MCIGRNVKKLWPTGNCFAFFGTRSRFHSKHQWQQHKNSLSAENSKQKIKKKKEAKKNDEHRNLFYVFNENFSQNEKEHH